MDERPDMTLWRAQLESFCPAAVGYADALNAGIERQKLSEPLVIAHLLAQMAHESGGFKVLQENLNYSASGLCKTWPTRFSMATAAEFANKPERIANHVDRKSVV